MTAERTPDSAPTPRRRARVTGPVPGPSGREYLTRQESRESRARTYPYRLPITVRHGEGSYLEDTDGNVYLDFLAGAGTLALGHSHPEVNAAVAEQLGVLSHGLDLPTPVRDEFAELVRDTLPETMRDRMRIHFCSPSGTNAVEAALKLCTTHTGRGSVVSFQGGFHGSTLGSMSATGLVAQKQPVPLGGPDVHFFPYSYCARCPLDLSPDSCNTNCATYLDRSLHDPNGGVPLPGAAVLELVQGEGGVIPAQPEFASAVRETTRSLGVPLIADEVQTGFGRTGAWYAFEHYDIRPDVVVLSKALGGVGMPVAVMLYDEQLDTWDPGAHIGTFRGNQLAFAAGVATMRIIARDEVLKNVQRRGEQLAALLAPLPDTSPWVSDVRGLGLMWGVELADPRTGAPAPALARSVQQGALRRGLILEVGGRDDAVIRLLPPLNCTATEIAEGTAILHEAFYEAVCAVAAPTPAPATE